jgi:hypothetical protein
LLLGQAVFLFLDLLALVGAELGAFLAGVPNAKDRNQEP